MKKPTFFASLCISVMISACSPKTTIAVASSSVLSTDVSNAQVEAAKIKFPGATTETLKQGHSLCYGVCTNCHGAKKSPILVKRSFPEL